MVEITPSLLTPHSVIPAKAGISRGCSASRPEIPAFAGMTIAALKETLDDLPLHLTKSFPTF